MAGCLTLIIHIALVWCCFNNTPAYCLTTVTDRLALMSFKGENNLYGKIPSGLFNISTIHYLSVSSNHLDGTIPFDIGLTLSNLRTIHLCLNSFTGMIPNSLVNASGLEGISFWDNEFTVPIPKDLGKLLHLQLVSLGNNRLQDDLSFISSLTNCTNLQYIQCGGNLLRGSLTESIGNISATVEFIELREYQVQGSIPSGLGNLVNLTFLDMASNQLSSPIPETMGKLHKLQELHLGGNSFTELPSSLGNLTLLNRLHLEQNNIYGSIPSSIGNFHYLLELNIAYNNLSGSIPPEIMSLSSISISLNLTHNRSTGALPLEAGSLTKVVELDFVGTCGSYVVYERY
ncbi:hypothetical protein Vadar_013820 [Vaccinium darrowii]|uniref:Uncharacterized protein n=1 Tax=Vaccinium darrowii TaxID=229202 RepID=A0ACB7Z3I8_9ERIC|nr:hypothetical protein Vadar_013820 [Vaccinium darrowii]